ncbi:hypothetical protein FRC07_004083 [Ceratobasidium sp. 392]|nr:hypothetical protein FRC07_004083 [Ceratobasidium sp. 392]
MTGPLRPARTQRRSNIAPYGQQPPAQPPVAERQADIFDDDNDPLPVVARQITRLYGMYWSPRAVLNADVELRRASQDNSEEVLRATASDSQKLNFELHDRLDELLPELFEQLAVQGSHFARHVRNRLEEGRNGAKAEDNLKVKNGIPLWRPDWTPALLNEPKSSRGLTHPETARRLAPISVDWEKEEQRRRFLELNKPAMTAGRLPKMLYADEKGDPKHPSVGLMQNQLLVDAAVALLKSPSAVIQSKSIRPGLVKRGRKGIAHKYKMEQVTTGFLAYVAVIVRFALSAEETFNEDGGTFNYVNFYWKIRTYLERPKYQRRAAELLKWWNQKLFPDSGHSHGSHDDDGDDEMFALLDAELEAEEEEERGLDPRSEDEN